MAGDPTEVDASYQVANLPTSLPPSGPAGGDLSGTYPDPTVASILGRALDMSGIATGKVLTWSGSVWHPASVSGSGMTGIFQINPNAGPYTGTTLVVDHATGFIASAGPTLSMALASLTQIGVIGSAEQMIQGPYYLVGVDRNFGHPHDPLPTYSAVIRDGILGFYDSGYDSTSGDLPVRMDWGITTPRVMTMYFNEALLMSCGNAGGSVIIRNVGAGSSISMGAIFNALSITDPAGVSLHTGTSPTTSAGLVPSFAVGTARGFNLTGTSGSPSLAYGIGGVAGVYGTTTDGTVVAGGIITTIGSTHAGGPPTGAAGGDLSGTYPNPTVAKLQTRAVSSSAPASGNVLTWSGSAWAPAAPAGGAPTGAAGGDLGGTYPNPTVVGLQTFGVATTAPVSGNVLTYNTGLWRPITPAAPTAIIDGSDNVTLDGAGGLTTSVGGASVISRNAAGDVVIGGAFGTLALDHDGSVTLTGAGGSFLTFDTSGVVTLQAGVNVVLQQDLAGNLSISGASSSMSINADSSLSIVSGNGSTFSVDAAGNVIFYTAAAASFTINGNLGQPGVVLDADGNLNLGSGAGVGVGFFGAAPPFQQTAHGITAGYTAHVSANTVFAESTFTGNFSSTAYTLGDIVSALKRYGLLAP